jgi:uncharacterized protein (DUF1697 family)
MAQKKTTWIALLRGVNVGGNHKLPMKELAAELEALGFTGVRTYIQSGNVVFRVSAAKRSATAASITSAIATCIQKKFGFQPSVMVLSKEELALAAKSNPFSEAEKERDGRTLHLFFLSQPPPKKTAREIDRAALDSVKLSSERWGIVGSVFYLHTPEGFGTSKLAAKAERCLGAPATARNWRTVCELLKLAESSE